MPQTRSKPTPAPAVVDEDQALDLEAAAAQLEKAAAALDGAGPGPDSDVWSTLPDTDYIYAVDANGTPDVENTPFSFDVAPFVLELLHELHGELVARRWVEFQARANSQRQAGQ